ncbi:MAG: hypothetical protein F4Y60_07345 [Boseongicola sp. SB0664_bin_43]|uniref:Dienelactone hydrolase n=1 Tax=Boseongicola sp. SB0664_bin_43 TaxID=2604844 RepID=A0A6B0Y1R0_9RHOB|nr:hypothetical protein [Boseongicola sp. SB0664_bin_43]
MKLNPMITVAVIVFPAMVAAGTPGFRPISVEAPHHGRPVAGGLWHPTEAAGHATVIAENPVFHGVEVIEDAPMADGPAPLVLLSHGLGGSMRSMAWLATGLAERGAIVVAVNHPNSTWGDFDMEAALDHWTRVADLSLALATVLADPEFADRIDPDRIMAAGFSFGGWTALSMGGVTGRIDRYPEHCEVYDASASHCQELASGGTELRNQLAVAWDASYKDPRVTHVAAIDPALVWGLERSDAAALVENVTLFGLGGGEDRLAATDFDASGFVDLVPHAAVERLVPAWHFSMLPLCKPAGAAILEEENDDPVCSDPDGADRAALHQSVIDRIAIDLGL